MTSSFILICKIFSLHVVFQMEFPDGDFSVVLDKGTLDALMTDSSEETVQTVEKVGCIKENVLKPYLSVLFKTGPLLQRLSPTLRPVIMEN